MTLSLIPRRLPAIVLGLTVSGFAAAACGVVATSAAAPPASESAPMVTPASTRQSPVRCEIVLNEARGATTIEARVSTGRAITGSYRLAIRSASAGGRAMISQSGEFDAAPGEPVILGSTTLGGARSNFRAELELSVGGQRLTCSEASGPREL